MYTFWVKAPSTTGRRSPMEAEARVERGAPGVGGVGAVTVVHDDLGAVVDVSQAVVPFSARMVLALADRVPLAA